MKLILVILSCLALAKGVNFNQWTYCQQVNNCYGRGSYQQNQEANSCYNQDTSSQCQYIRQHVPYNYNTTWDVVYGENWHGCWRICRDKSPNYVDCVEQCNIPMLKVSLAILAMLAWFM